MGSFATHCSPLKTVLFQRKNNVLKMDLDIRKKTVNLVKVSVELI